MNPLFRNIFVLIFGYESPKNKQTYSLNHSNIFIRITRVKKKLNSPTEHFMFYSVYCFIAEHSTSG